MSTKVALHYITHHDGPGTRYVNLAPGAPVPDNAPPYAVEEWEKNGLIADENDVEVAVDPINQQRIFRLKPKKAEPVSAEPESSEPTA